jgi:hypothetical protein
VILSKLQDFKNRRELIVIIGTKGKEGGFGEWQERVTMRHTKVVPYSTNGINKNNV